MSGAYLAVFVAGLGVLGTLSSPIVATWLSKRTRRQELELQQQKELIDRREEGKQRLINERRLCYTTLNAAARRHHGAMRAFSHAADGGEDRRISAEEQLAEARREYRHRYTEAQMIVPDEVLEQAGHVNVMLAGAYRMLRRVDEGVQQEQVSFERVRRMLDDGSQHLADMRSSMRRDLGIGSD
jgi:hypothetical protein